MSPQIKPISRQPKLTLKNLVKEAFRAATDEVMTDDEATEHISSNVEHFVNTKVADLYSHIDYIRASGGDLDTINRLETLINETLTELLEGR